MEMGEVARGSVRRFVDGGLAVLMKNRLRNWHPVSVSGHESSDNESLACVSRLQGKGYYRAITSKFDIPHSFKVLFNCKGAVRLVWDSRK